MKILVIGAGLFGTAVAIKIKEKYKNSNVTIVDELSDILNAASGKNQFRTHLGFHYPRSPKTIRECQHSSEEFKKYLSSSFIKSEDYYAISKKKSKINFQNYIRSLERNNLKFNIIEKNELLKKSEIEGIIKVNEKKISIDLARKKIWKLLNKHSIDVKLNKKVFLNKGLSIKYDKIILCTYDRNNLNLENFGIKNMTEYFYQLVEKIIIKPPTKFLNKSFVILDGPFMCIDPYNNEKKSILGHVEKSVIAKQISNSHNFNDKFKLLSQYVVDTRKNGKFNQIKKDFCRYFNHFENVKYFGSFWVVRCTMKSNFDHRLTEILTKNKIITVFSGKWINCFNTANKIIEKI